MSHMQMQIVKDSFFRIETTEGTEVVPSHVCGRTTPTDAFCFPAYLDGGLLVTQEDESIECEEGFVARMSAPGYLDCTSWSAHKSEAEAVAFLERMYGDAE